MTDAFAPRRMADAVRLVQRVRHMIGECALFQNPLVVGGEKARRRKHDKHDDCASIHTSLLAKARHQNFTDTDNNAAPKAPAVTMATGPCAAAMPCTLSPLFFWLKAIAPSIGVRIIPGP